MDMAPTEPPHRQRVGSRRWTSRQPKGPSTGNRSAPLPARLNGCVPSVGGRGGGCRPLPVCWRARKRCDSSSRRPAKRHTCCRRRRPHPRHKRWRPIRGRRTPRREPPSWCGASCFRRGTSTHRSPIRPGSPTTPEPSGPPTSGEGPRRSTCVWRRSSPCWRSWPPSRRTAFSGPLTESIATDGTTTSTVPATRPGSMPCCATSGLAATSRSEPAGRRPSPSTSIEHHLGQSMAMTLIEPNAQRLRGAAASRRRDNCPDHRAARAGALASSRSSSWVVAMSA